MRDQARQKANLIVSAHGGRWSDTTADLPVPADQRIDYYVHDGDTLDGWTASAILKELQQGREPGGTVVDSVSGADTYPYEMWYDHSWAAECGIFEVGSTTLVKSLKHHTEKNPYPLEQLLKDFPDREVIYWVSCRSVSDRKTEKYLSNPPESSMRRVPA